MAIHRRFRVEKAEFAMAAQQPLRYRNLCADIRIEAEFPIIINDVFFGMNHISMACHQYNYGFNP
jgi:hypothetical protein